MPTYYSADTVKTPGRVKPARQGLNIVNKSITIPIGSILTSAGVTKLSSGDVIELVKVPAGATILDIRLNASIIDGAGATTAALSWSIGDGNDSARYLASYAVNGTANGVVSLRTSADCVSNTWSGLAIAKGIGYKYTSEDTIDALITGAPASNHTSNAAIRISVTYQTED